MTRKCPTAAFRAAVLLSGLVSAHAQTPFEGAASGQRDLPQGRVVWSKTSPLEKGHADAVSKPDGSVVVMDGGYLQTIASDGAIGPPVKIATPCVALFATTEATFCTYSQRENSTGMARVSDQGETLWRIDSPGFRQDCQVLSDTLFCRLVPEDMEAQPASIRLRAYGPDGVVSEIDTPPHGSFAGGAGQLGHLGPYYFDGRDDFIRFDLRTGRQVDATRLSGLKDYHLAVQEVGPVHLFASGRFIVEALVTEPFDHVNTIALNADGTLSQEPVAYGNDFTVDHCGGVALTRRGGGTHDLKAVFTDSDGAQRWEFEGIRRVVAVPGGDFFAFAEHVVDNEVRYSIMRITPPEGVAVCR